MSKDNLIKVFFVIAFMDLKEKLTLIQRNTVEVVEEKELESLLKDKKKPVAYCGYEPSGPVHLGHYVTVSKLIELETAGFQIKILFADWHAWLNKKGTWDEINAHVKTWQKAFQHMGLKNPEFVVGSSFQKTPDYFDDVLKLSQDITIKRGLRSMQDVARDVDHASVSQILYPLMQIVDIKHLGVDVAESGIEQRKIHMLARESLEKIEYKKPVLIHTPLINSLTGPGKKMSSSEMNSMIAVTDEEVTVTKKMNKAYCIEGDVKENPVLDIVQYILFPRLKVFTVERPEKFGGTVSFPNFEALQKAFASKQLHPGDLKQATAKELVLLLKPMQKFFPK
jgi:tyrosyl-tRNA synthetase